MTKQNYHLATTIVIDVSTTVTGFMQQLSRNAELVGETSIIRNNPFSQFQNIFPHDKYSSQRKKQSSNWIVNKPGRHHLNQVTEVNNIVSNGAKEALCAPWGGLLRTHNVLPVLLVLTKCITRLSETASDRLNLRNILQSKPHTHTQPQQWKAKIEELSQIKRLKRRDNTV